MVTGSKDLRTGRSIWEIQRPPGVRDVPLTHLIIRTRDANAPLSQGGDRPRPAQQAVVDHICFTVAGFNRDRAKVAPTALGVKNLRELSDSQHMDDPFGYDVISSATEK